MSPKIAIFQTLPFHTCWTQQEIVRVCRKISGTFCDGYRLSCCVLSDSLWTSYWGSWQQKLWTNISRNIGSRHLPPRDKSEKIIWTFCPSILTLVRNRFRSLCVRSSLSVSARGGVGGGLQSVCSRASMPLQLWTCEPHPSSDSCCIAASF